MLDFKSFITEGKSPYSSDVEQDIVRFHADGIRNSIKTGENFGFDHVQEYVQDNHPDYPSNIQTLRKHIFAPAAHHRISSDIEKEDSDFERVNLQRGAGKRQKSIPSLPSKQLQRLKAAKDAGVSNKDLSDRFGIPQSHIKHHLNEVLLTRNIKKPKTTKGSEPSESDLKNIEFEKNDHLDSIEQGTNKFLGKTNIPVGDTHYHLHVEKTPSEEDDNKHDVTYKMVHPDTNEVHMTLMGEQPIRGKDKKTVSIKYLSSSHPGRELSALDFYKHLIKDKKLNLESDNILSKGGRGVWNALTRTPGIEVTLGDKKIPFRGKKTFAANFTHATRSGKRGNIDFTPFVARYNPNSNLHFGPQ